MRPKLTATEKRLFEYLEQILVQEGRAPSLRRTAAEFAVSHAAVAQTLKSLEEKGYIRREGRYSRTIHLLNPAEEPAALHRAREVPLVGHIQAGLPMYAQQEWEGTVVVDSESFRADTLFALRVRGDSMKDVGILDGDVAVCEPRQFARNGEIVVALVDGEEATVKRFFRHADHIELRPENPDHPVQRYGFDRVLIQGRVVGIHRGPEVMNRL